MAAEGVGEDERAAIREEFEELQREYRSMEAMKKVGVAGGGRRGGGDAGGGEGAGEGRRAGGGGREWWCAAREAEERGVGGDEVRRRTRTRVWRL
jgi:hypothetical protein